MVIAIKATQRKRAAEAAEVTDETVKSWIANENAPRFVETVRLARKVPKIRAALYELIDGREIDAQVHHKVLPLLDVLHQVAQGGGEMAELAHKTLKEFAGQG